MLSALSCAWLYRRYHAAYAVSIPFPGLYGHCGPGVLNTRLPFNFTILPEALSIAAEDPGIPSQDPRSWSAFAAHRPSNFSLFRAAFRQTVDSFIGMARADFLRTVPTTDAVAQNRRLDPGKDTGFALRHLRDRREGQLPRAKVLRGMASEASRWWSLSFHRLPLRLDPMAVPHSVLRTLD